MSYKDSADEKSIKKSSLETIQAKSDNILSRLYELSSSLDYVANGGKPISNTAADKSAQLKETPHIEQINTTLNRIQSSLSDCENLLSKIRYG